MPTLLVEDVPVDLYERIREQARTQNRSISAEVVGLLRHLLPEGRPSAQTGPTGAPEEGPPMRPIADYPFLTEEISPPFDLPRPGPGVRVHAIDGGVRLPDPFTLPEE